jgi:hemolysin III
MALPSVIHTPPPNCPSDTALHLYRHHCVRLASPPCPAVLRGLAGMSTTLSARGDTAAFPLLALLRAGGAPHVRTLDIGGASLSADTLDSLCALLRAQGGDKGKKSELPVRIERLLLRRARVRDVGAAKILHALADCGPDSPLRELGLRGNRITHAGGAAFAAAIETGPATGVAALRRIDLSNNNLDHAGVVAVQKAIKLVGADVDLFIDGNLVLIEVLNAATHGIGVVGAIAGGSVLAYKASGVLPVSQTLAVILFCLSLCTMFLSSCLYHSFFRFPPCRGVFHTCDHCSIFVLIAGSYTPFIACYTLDPMTFAGPLVLASVWVCAIVGVLISFKVIKASNATRAYFALAMGWIGIIPVRTIAERMQPRVIALVVTGGVTYSIGLLFYLAGRRRPMLHVVWHIAVMMGGSFHFAGLWDFVAFRSAAAAKASALSMVTRQ